MSFPICSFIVSAFYHFVLILFGTSLFGPSLYCPLSFSYSTTWPYKLFVLVLFWTSYFGPFPFCRLLFCPLILCPVCSLAFHYLVLRKFVLFHFVHRTMWKTRVHLMLMTHGCRRYVFFFFFFFCIVAHIILLAQFNSCVINIHFVKLYDAIILWFTIISIYSLKAHWGNSPLAVWLVRYQAFQYIDQRFESHSHHF